MNNKRVKKAFSMIELVFVIVILGILASVAIPKLMATREDAYIAKGKNQVASIKNGINMVGSKNLLGGGCSSGSRYPEDLNSTPITQNAIGEQLFGYVLKEPIISSNSDGSWKFVGTSDTSTLGTPITDERYTYQISPTKIVTFTYYNTASSSPNVKAGTFYCDPTDSNCLTLTK